MSETKRRVTRPADTGTIENVQFNAAAGAQKQMTSILPVPVAVPVGAAAGNNAVSGATFVGKGKLVWLSAAGVTLTDSTGKYQAVVISSALAPIGSVVSTGLYWDTVTGTGLIVEDDSIVESQNYPSGS